MAKRTSAPHERAVKARSRLQTFARLANDRPDFLATIAPAELADMLAESAWALGYAMETMALIRNAAELTHGTDALEAWWAAQ